MNNILGVVCDNQLNKELIFVRGEIIFFTHATESAKKLLEGINVMLAVRGEHFESKEKEGHFGNSIQITQANLSNSESESLVNKIITGLRMGDRTLFAREIENYLDSDGNLYIRLDKQELLRRNLVLAERDPIRIKVKLMSRKKDRLLLVQGCQKLLLE